MNPISEIELMRADELARALPVSHVWLATGLLMILALLWAHREWQIARRAKQVVRAQSRRDAIDEFCELNELDIQTRAALGGGR